MAGELEFDEFYDASFRRVVGQVYAMVGNLSAAEDRGLSPDRKALAPHLSEVGEAGGHPAPAASGGPLQRGAKYPKYPKSTSTNRSARIDDSSKEGTHHV